MDNKAALVPYILVREAYSNRADVSGVQAMLELEGLPATRNDARDLIKHAVRELEEDVLSQAPTSGGVLSKQIDTILEVEVKRLTKEMRVMQSIITSQNTVGTEHTRYNVEGEKGTITAELAAERLATSTRQLLEIKKSVSDEAKATQSNDMNIQVNLGAIVSDALSNIKEAEIVNSKTLKE